MDELIKMLSQKLDDVIAEYEDNRQKITKSDISVEACVRLGREEVLARWADHLADTIKLLEGQG